MKKIFPVLCLLVFLLNTGVCKGQGAADSLPPFRKNPMLPAFTIRLLDSVTLFNTASIRKGKPTVFVLFSPDCDHCAQLAQQIKDSADAWEQVNFYMISPPVPLFDIKMFAHINGLAGKKQITVGQDMDFFFGSFFHAETVPFIVLYDKNRKFSAIMKMVRSVNELLTEVRKLQGKERP